MSNSPYRVVLFGELLMRLEPPQTLRLLQAQLFDAGFAGAEANAGALLSRFGVEAYVVSAVPDHELGLACTNHLRRYGMDVTVSCDVINRSALWSVEAARATLPEIVRHVDVLVSNAEHARPLLGCPDSSREFSDPLDVLRYELGTQFSRSEFDLRAAALTIRGGNGLDETSIAAVFDDGGQLVHSPTYRVRPIDRMGPGDAFTGALVYGILRQLPAQETVGLAAAANCLKHADRGDFCLASLEQVELLHRNGSDGRVRR